MNYKQITETFFYWTINTENYSSLSDQNGAYLCLKCIKVRLAAAPELMRSPNTPTCNRGAISKGRERMGGGLQKGGEKGRKERGREFLSPKSS